ncbi:MAG: N-acetylmuramoyl-L-alanine amidase [Pseudomonadota bacterium]
MKNYNFKRLLVLFAFLATLLAVQAYAATDSDYSMAKQCYAKLTPKSPRSNWLECLDLFGLIAANSEKGTTAQNATYTVARIRKELYEKDKQKDDLLESIEFYNRVVRDYPKGNLADDSLFMIANLRYDYLNENEKAKNALEALIKRYPNGDRTKDAKALLAKIGGGSQASAKLAANTTASKSTKAAAVDIDDDVERVETRYTSGSVSKGELANARKPATLLSIVEERVSDGQYNVILNLDRPTVYETLFTPPGLRINKFSELDMKLMNTRLNKGLVRNKRVNHSRLKQVRIEKGFFSGNALLALRLGDMTAYKTYSKGDKIVIALTKYTGSPFDIVPKNDNDSAEPQAKVGSKGRSQLKIVIDPGHGGKDPGAKSKNGLMEKDLTLDISKRLAKVLKKNLNAKVWMTRSRDKYLTLEERNKLARDKEADLFISVHVNAAKDKKLSGIETYYLNNASDEASKRLASRENVNAGKSLDEVQHILSTMLQNYSAEESKSLATNIHKELLSELSRSYKGVNDLNVKSALFYVLVGAKCPGVLLELSFISNPTEEKRLKNNVYKNHLVNGVAKGLTKYVNKRSTDKGSGL